MLLALLADMHANRQAFSACLEHAREHGAERFALLGDFVGYGADPAWSVAKAMELTAGGALAVRGNHDLAVSGAETHMNLGAKIVIDWTKGELGVEERQFLANLPMRIVEGDYLFVHGDASAPDDWIYVTSVQDAAASLMATKARITFCGHVHQPAIYSVTPTAKMTAFTPVTDVPVPLHGMRRWLVVLGSVGQPRDGNPAASYAMLDTDRNEITFLRVPYDIHKAADAIKTARLPQFFADRLFIGR